MPIDRDKMDARVAKLAKNVSKFQYYDEECPVCRHPERGDIDYSYASWGNPEVICEAWSIDQKTLEHHVAHARLGSLRRYNTDALYERIVELGVKDPKSLGLKARDVLDAAKQLDKLHGRIIERSEVDERKVVIFAPIPAPGGVRMKNEEQKDALKDAGPTRPALPGVLLSANVVKEEAQ